MICKDCKFSVEIKGKRHCQKMEGNHICLNAREAGQSCGPDGKHFKEKKVKKDK